jgi:hypothetical protein
MWGRRTGLGGGVTESRGFPKARVCGSVTVEERPVTKEIGQRLSCRQRAPEGTLPHPPFREKIL